MGKFDYLLGKGKEVKIPSADGGEDVYIIKQLTQEHMGIFLDSEGVSQEDMMNKLVTASLQQTDPSITEEDVRLGIPLILFQEIFKVVSEVNELDKK